MGVDCAVGEGGRVARGVAVAKESVGAAEAEGGGVGEVEEAGLPLLAPLTEGCREAVAGALAVGSCEDESVSRMERVGPRVALGQEEALALWLCAPDWLPEALKEGEALGLLRAVVEALEEGCSVVAPPTLARALPLA